jgi:hypothetical protein
LKQDYILIAEIGGLAIAAGVVIYALYEITKKGGVITQAANYLNSPQAAYAAATSNPISQAVASGAIKTQATNMANAAALGANYSNALVEYTTAEPTFPSLIGQSAQSNNAPILLVTPAGVGSYGGNIDSSTYSKNQIGSSTGNWANGSLGNAYNSAKTGWQGAGYYTNNTIYPALTQYYGTQAEWSQANISS